MFNFTFQFKPFIYADFDNLGKQNCAICDCLGKITAPRKLYFRFLPQRQVQ